MSLISMDQAEINNWARIAVDLEVAGEIDSVLYERALDQPAQGRWLLPVRIERCQFRRRPPDQQQSLPSC